MSFLGQSPVSGSTTRLSSFSIRLVVSLAAGSGFFGILNLNQIGITDRMATAAVIWKGNYGLKCSHKYAPIYGAGSETSPMLL
jgi:hypothetical protein